MLGRYDFLSPVITLVTQWYIMGFNNGAKTQCTIKLLGFAFMYINLISIFLISVSPTLDLGSGFAPSDI